jgi:hypothetical protein
LIEAVEKRNVFSQKTSKLIKEVSEPNPTSIDDLIRVQEANDKSAVTKQLLTSWAAQQNEERKLRKIYAISIIVVLSLQVVMLNILFILLGNGSLSFSDTQINVFFISVFVEIVSLILIVTKYLFPKKTDSDILSIIKHKGG